MKKIIISLVTLTTLALVSSYAQSVKEIVLPSTSTSLAVTLQNPSVNSTYTWTEVTTSGLVQTDLTTLNTALVNIQLVNTVVAGDQVTISVAAESVVGNCDGAAINKVLKVVTTATYQVTSFTAPAAVCQGDVPAAIPVTFNATIDRFTYFIDLNSNGIVDAGTESLVSVNVGGTSSSISVGALAASCNLQINSITAGTLTSPSTSTVTLTANERPVILTVD